MKDGKTMPSFRLLVRENDLIRHSGDLAEPLELGRQRQTLVR